MNRTAKTKQPPSGNGCLDCLRDGTWWFHLRRCALCGRVGCCDSSPNRHARRHYHETGHPVVQSFEPGETWFWNYGLEQEVDGSELMPPHHHPLSQPVPGPEGKVPQNWMSLLNK